MLTRRETFEAMAAALGSVLLPAPDTGLLPVPDMVASVQKVGGVCRIEDGDIGHARRTATRLAIRVELTAVASDAAALAGYGNLNAGRLAEAGSWFYRALKLAREAGDRRLEAYALSSCAWPFLLTTDPNRATALLKLQAAAELQGVLPPAGRAWVFGNLALEHAAWGNDLASGRFLEQARIAAARVSRTGPGWGWWSTHGELDGWDAIRPDAFAARRAACASAQSALDEAETHDLGLWQEKVRRARLMFPREWSGLGVVRDLDERLRLAA